MKNVIKTIKRSILLVTVFTTMLSSANEISVLNLKEGFKSTALVVDNVKEGNLISIKDFNGITIYKEQIDFSGTYKKGFDLSALPNGDYYFEVDKGLEIKTMPFIVTFNEVVFDRENEKTIFKPSVRKENDLVLISKLSPNAETLNINIYAEVDNSFELVHSEKIEETQNIQRIYKLQEKGHYKIVFNTDKKEFTEFINN